MSEGLEKCLDLFFRDGLTIVAHQQTQSPRTLRVGRRQLETQLDVASTDLADSVGSARPRVDDADPKPA